MENDFLIDTEQIPRVRDAVIAMRVPSFVVLLFSTWFAGTPIAYYGVSDQPSAANCIIAGGLVMASAAIRLVWPLSTMGFAWFNVLMGLWIFISPFVLGYVDQTAYTVNTMIMGVIIVGMSLASIFARRFIGTPLATAYEDRQGLDDQDYEYIGPDKRFRL
jgi:small neutral amino acid transporter SnatA (MarC family)